MKRPERRRTRGWAAALMAACLLGGGVTLAPAAQADSTPAGSAIPPHVFAPYFYSNSPTDNLLTVSTASSANYLTLAFLQTKAPGDCTVFWNGRNDSPVGPTYAAGIAAIRAAGGDVFPSFGGAAAGSLGTELADSCTDVNAIADEFKRVITAYNFTRIDLDVEEGALTEAGKAGVDRRNKAIKIVQDWAAAEGRVIEFVYTQPTWTTGLNDGSMYLIQNAIDNGARIDGVNIMTFDYYDEVSEACKAGTGPAHDMAASTIAAATSLYGILHNFYPDKTPAQLWGMIGVIEMPGNSDFGKCEEFKIADATTILNWAVEKNILAISFWSIQRDTKNRGGSPVAYGFSKILSQFTHWDNQNQTVISASVLGGTLSMSVSSTAPIVLPPLTLNGANQVLTSALNDVRVANARGTSAGWSLTGQVSDFRETASTNLILAANLGWAPTASVVVDPLALVTSGPAPAVTPGAVKVPGAGLSTAQTLCLAAGGTSAGSFDCGGALNLGVPSSTPIGTYTGVLTLTLI